MASGRNIASCSWHDLLGGIKLQIPRTTGVGVNICTKCHVWGLSTRVSRVAKRFFGVPEFHYYALADGISMLLSRLGV